MDPGQIIPPITPELILPPDQYPNLDHLITEDDTPVDSIFAALQQMLLVESLVSCWNGGNGGRPFLALPNVGLFHAIHEPAVVPAVMVGRDVKAGSDLMVKQNRSWFVWVMGKAPDVVVEIVSDRRGGELGYKKDRYARAGVSYYVVFDPAHFLEQGVLLLFELRAGTYEPMAEHYMAKLGLGVALWQGMYEKAEESWLRWADAAGNLIPTGKEAKEQAEKRTEEVQQQLERLREKMRARGLDPDA